LHTSVRLFFRLRSCPEATLQFYAVRLAKLDSERLRAALAALEGAVGPRPCRALSSRNKRYEVRADCKRPNVTDGGQTAARGWSVGLEAASSG